MFQRGMMMVEEKKEVMNQMILEINLISAQGLKSRSKDHHGTTQTYAVVWVDSSMKLRTKIDRLGGPENPTWNDKFLFLVSPDFVASETSAVTVEIYEVGQLRDFLMGTARFLLSTCFGKFTPGIPAFTVVRVQRPSGRFHGFLNIAATVCNSTSDGGADLGGLFHGSSAVSLRVDVEKEKEKDNNNSLRRRLSQRLRRVGSRDSLSSSNDESSSSLRAVSSSSSLSTLSSTDDGFPLRTVKSLPSFSTTRSSMLSDDDRTESSTMDLELESVASSSSLSSMLSDIERMNVDDG